ncbi:MAG TPA: carboxymuconolactone decarboxylase family protein [Paracoccaceae bacterium]|nr:carboxymuconolactone decarboxylase family protein [Paracoccaceae bacterium]
MSADPVLDLAPLTPETAEPKAREKLEAAKSKLGFVPNMYGNMGHLPELLEAYMSAYQGFREGAGFTPPEQEVVFLSVSLENGCDYCAAAHSMLAEKVSKVPADSLAALRDGRSLPDAKLDALAKFTRRMVESRGEPAKADVEAFLSAGYESRHVLGIILAIGVKTYSNYTNHVAGTEIDEAFAGHAVPA